MKTFWEYLHNEQIALPIDSNSTPSKESENDAISQPIATPQPATQGFKPKIKPWKAKKSDIMTFWRSLAPNMPLHLQSIDSVHKGSTLQQDTLRITGSKEFITTVLSRLKDFIVYENPSTKLVLDYRQNAKSLKPGEKNSYLFYLNVRNRK
jgi:hypothetical protein